MRPLSTAISMRTALTSFSMELVNLKINPSPIFPPLLSGIFGVINAADHFPFVVAIHIINKNGICFASNAEAYS